MKDEMLNVRIEKNVRSAAYSGGFFDCKEIYLHLLGLKIIPGTTGVTTVTVPKVWYGLQEETNDSEYCFRKYIDEYNRPYFNLSRSPDENGNPRWAWADSQCKSSILKVRHL